MNDHISEAKCHTKKNQCHYLNNAIRKNGADCFEVELLERTSLDRLDALEEHYISAYNSLYPNGYNLTIGGKVIPKIKIKSSEPLNKKMNKRGRDFGYKHKKTTREKMSTRRKLICDSDEVRGRMKDVMKSYYDAKKVDILSEYDIGENIDQYIKPVISKTTGEVHDYVIRINGRKLTLYSKEDTIEEKYQRLYDVLSSVRERKKVKPAKIFRKEEG